MTTAEELMRHANRNAVIGTDDDGAIVMIEDVMDSDGRFYKLEYRTTPDGRHALAYCRWNPWGEVNGGESYRKGHVDPEGFICIGNDATKDLSSSPYDFEFVLKRSRYWCNGFSYLKEHGEFLAPEDV